MRVPCCIELRVICNDGRQVVCFPQLHGLADGVGAVQCGCYGLERKLVINYQPAGELGGERIPAADPAVGMPGSELSSTGSSGVADVPAGHNDCCEQ